MAETIEQLEAQRTALKRAMRSGALSVGHGDKRVQYRSIEEMKSVLDDLNEEIAELGGAKKKRVFYVGGGRGY
ncbi:phage head-tail joining protein [Ensifer sp. LCM 4579]|uniref:phage head-tail joining protein n=1 Tax=Ensifer sp. LCM 4579 TaxID=1848292 RepID=UPI0008DA049E|nr:hypothetical protein [Ensifer sp. LCM 4579]OHV85797.1 hypothetical protein LCM4579_00040 [Ensifer sp. LCM 4579]